MEGRGARPDAGRSRPCAAPFKKHTRYHTTNIITSSTAKSLKLVVSLACTSSPVALIIDSDLRVANPEPMQNANPEPVKASEPARQMDEFRLANRSKSQLTHLK